MKLIYYIIRFLIQKNEGFDAKKEKKQIKEDGDHYDTEAGQLGAIFGKRKVIKPDRNWMPDAQKIEFEAQKKRVETMFCTEFNTENPIQIYQQAVYGKYDEGDEIPMACAISFCFNLSLFFIISIA